MSDFAIKTTKKKNCILTNNYILATTIYFVNIAKILKDILKFKRNVIKMSLPAMHLIAFISFSWVLEWLCTHTHSALKHNFHKAHGILISVRF